MRGQSSRSKATEPLCSRHRTRVKPAARNDPATESIAGFICGSRHELDCTSTRVPIADTVDHSRARCSVRCKSAAITSPCGAAGGATVATLGAETDGATGAGCCSITTGAEISGGGAAAALFDLLRSAKYAMSAPPTSTATTIAPIGGPCLADVSAVPPTGDDELRENRGNARWHFGHRT
jgi:hypothetical protein